MGTFSPSAARIALSSQDPITKTDIGRNVHHVVLGDILFKTWYPSYYPEELVGKELERLYVCQWCFKYTADVNIYQGHMMSCSYKGNTPGSLIYSKDSYSIFEVDGEEYQLYAQNLSLFAKLFLDNKSVFFDVIGFHYYLLVRESEPAVTQIDAPDSQIVGFFSKEKMSWDNNNLACILIFPPWQRQGLGKILMGASYELSEREGRIGSPEKPLSGLGKKGYYKFWEARIARTILGIKTKRAISVQDIGAQCWLSMEDTMEALKDMNVLEPKGKKANAGLAISKAKVKQWASDKKVDLKDPIDSKDFITENILSLGPVES